MDLNHPDNQRQGHYAAASSGGANYQAPAPLQRNAMAEMLSNSGNANHPGPAFNGYAQNVNFYLAPPQAAGAVHGYGRARDTLSPYSHLPPYEQYGQGTSLYPDQHQHLPRRIDDPTRHMQPGHVNLRAPTGASHRGVGDPERVSSRLNDTTRHIQPGHVHPRVPTSASNRGFGNPERVSSGLNDRARYVRPERVAYQRAPTSAFDQVAGNSERLSSGLNATAMYMRPGHVQERPWTSVSNRRFEDPESMRSVLNRPYEGWTNPPLQTQQPRGMRAQSPAPEHGAFHRSNASTNAAAVSPRHILLQSVAPSRGLDRPPLHKSCLDAAYESSSAPRRLVVPNSAVIDSSQVSGPSRVGNISQRSGTSRQADVSSSFGSVRDATQRSQSAASKPPQSPMPDLGRTSIGQGLPTIATPVTSYRVQGLLEGRDSTGMVIDSPAPSIQAPVARRQIIGLNEDLRMLSIPETGFQSEQSVQATGNPSRNSSRQILAGRQNFQANDNARGVYSESPNAGDSRTGLNAAAIRPKPGVNFSYSETFKKIDANNDGFQRSRVVTRVREVQRGHSSSEHEDKENSGSRLSFTQRIITSRSAHTSENPIGGKDRALAQVDREADHSPFSDDGEDGALAPVDREADHSPFPDDEDGVLALVEREAAHSPFSGDEDREYKYIAYDDSDQEGEGDNDHEHDDNEDPEDSNDNTEEGPQQGPDTLFPCLPRRWTYFDEYRLKYYIFLCMDCGTEYRRRKNYPTEGYRGPNCLCSQGDTSEV